MSPAPITILKSSKNEATPYANSVMSPALIMLLKTSKNEATPYAYSVLFHQHLFCFSK